MSRPEPSAVARVACIGGGTIGGAWVAHFLRMGFDVAAWDPATDGEARVRTLVENVWPTLEKLGLTAGASPDRLTYGASLEQALEGAEFVQESAPENVAIKVDLLARIDAAAAADVVIASSTSGYSMSDLQAGCATPERTVVGHPFHPVYLVPLVEVAPGERTAAAAVDWAMRFYDLAGKAAVRCEDHVHGFIANRLQAAILRESMHMVASGEATVRDIDVAISQGPGLRWALMGPFLTIHLAGGDGGMRDFFAKFPGDFEEPYTRLAAPEVTDPLREAMIAGAETLARGRTPAELAHRRDALLVEMLQLIGDGLTAGGSA